MVLAVGREEHEKREQEVGVDRTGEEVRDRKKR